MAQRQVCVRLAGGHPEERTTTQDQVQLAIESCKMQFLSKHIPLYNKSPDCDLHRHWSEKGRQFATISHYQQIKANTMGLLPIRQVDSTIIS